MPNNNYPKQEMSRRTRRLSSPSALARWPPAAWEWLNSRAGRMRFPLRCAACWASTSAWCERALQRPHLVQTYPASAIGDLKINGDIGMEDPIRPRQLASVMPRGIGLAQSLPWKTSVDSRATKRPSTSNAWKAGAP